MDFSAIALNPEQTALQREVGDLLDSLLTDDVREAERRHGEGFALGYHFALGERGLLQPTWPVELGGRGYGPLEARIVELEQWRRDAPSLVAATTAMAFRAVQDFGRADLVTELAPKVARGEVRICLGYSEPDGGSDVADAKTRAVRDGDDWVINGQKMFTTGAQNCQYSFLLTRTDPTLPKHRGLTTFLVPLDTPGVEIHGMRAFSGERTNVVYYEDVRISDRYRLGEVNGGWAVMRGPLDEEHSIGAGADQFADTSIGIRYLRLLEQALEAAIAWALNTIRPDGAAVADDPIVQRGLGLVTMELELAANTQGAMGRVACSEALIRGVAILLDLIGPRALLPHGAPGAIGDGLLEGKIEEAHRTAQGTSTYGGTTEVFRVIIAQHMLNLPRPEFAVVQNKKSSAKAWA